MWGHGDRLTGAERYLIVGGAYRSATTSVYRYLADHPEVCGSSIKETRFFLDLDYPVPSPFRYTEGLAAYEQYYSGCAPGAVRMESTPFYLYSPGTARRIREMLPNAQLMFVLRDPIARLASCHRFELAASADKPAYFDDYVAEQVADLTGWPELGHTLQLPMGRYADFLAPYLETFGREGVLVTFFEDLVTTPAVELKRIVRFAGLDEACYDDYQFEIHNQAIRQKTRLAGHLRRSYDEARMVFSRYTVRMPRVHRRLRTLKHWVEPHLDQLASDPMPRDPMSVETRRFLEDFYRADARQLERLVGRPAPWTWCHANPARPSPSIALTVPA